MPVERPIALARRSFLSLLAAVPFLGTSQASPDSNQQPVVDETDSTVTIGNDQIELTLRRDNGGIEQVRTVEQDLTLCNPSARRETTHWRLGFYSDEYDRLHASSVNAPSPTIDVSEGSDRTDIRLEWTDAELVDPAEGVIGRFDGSIVSRVAIESGSPLVRWHLEVHNNGDRAIETATCPEINGIGPLEPDGDDELVVPQGIGMRSRNPTENGALGITYPSGLGTMQFTAYTSDAGGFYTDAQDTDGYTKELSWAGEQSPAGAGSLSYKMRHYTPRQPGADFSLPYSATVGALDGDWYDAADRYRAWLLEEGWLSAEDTGVPDAARHNGAIFHLTSYTREFHPDPLPEISYDQVVERVAALREYLGAPVELVWRGWQTHGRSHGLDWYPPKEGMKAFESAMDSLTEHDVTVMGFLSAVWVWNQSDFWQENRDRVSNWLRRAEDGSRIEPTYGHGHPEESKLYGVELSQEGYTRAIAIRLRRFAGLGGDSAHLDGFPWQWVPECYADHHDHPPGLGGNWYPVGSRQALRDIQQTVRAENPAFLLSGEGLSDFYLPYLQGGHFRSAAAEHHEEIPELEHVTPLPVLPYTLGDFHVIWSATVFPESPNVAYQRLVAGRALVWGTIPWAWRMPPAEELDTDLPVLDYLGRVARARTTYAARFLAEGKMLRPPTIETETVTMETQTVAAGSSTVQVWTPAILTGACQSARDETGFVFTNVSPDDGSKTVDFDLSAQPTWLPNKPWLIYKVRNGTYETVSTASTNESHLSVELENSDIAVLVVAPASEPQREALNLIIEAQEAASDEERRAVEEAKRKFENDDLTEAVNIAKVVIEGESTSASAEAPSTRGSATETNRETTSEGAPGFTVLTGLVGLGVAAASRLLRSHQKEKKEE